MRNIRTTTRSQYYNERGNLAYKRKPNERTLVVVRDSLGDKGYVVGIPHGKKITRFMRNTG